MTRRTDMKRKNIPLLLVLIVLSTLVLGACSGKDEPASDIVGKWSYTTEGGNEQTYIFNSDGTIELITALGNASGTYQVEGDTISYTMLMPNNKSKSDSMTFKLNKDALDLTMNGHTYTYKKVS